LFPKAQESLGDEVVLDNPCKKSWMWDS